MKEFGEKKGRGEEEETRRVGDAATRREKLFSSCFFSASPRPRVPASLPLPLFPLILIFALLSSCTREMRGPLAFVSTERDGTITIINTATNRVVSTIQVGARARGIHLSPDNSHLFVALSYPTNSRRGEDKIAEIDVASGSVIAKYDAGTDPENFIISADGARLYIANEDAGTASVTDMKTNHVVATMVVGFEPEGVALSPDGRWIYVTSETNSMVSVIDAQSNKVIKTFLVDARPREAAFSPDGAWAYVSAENGGTVSVVDVKSHTVVDRIQIPGNGEQPAKPKGVVVSPDGKTVYVATGRANSVAVIDAASRKVLAMIAVGERPWGIAITPDGRRLYTANGISNDISVIDTATNKVISTIRAGDGPWGVVIRP